MTYAVEVFAATGWARFGEGAAGGAALLAVVVFPFLRWGIPRLVRRVGRMFDHAVMESLERIEAQVTPNGGTSKALADRVVRTEENQKVIARAVGVAPEELAPED